MIFSEWRCTLHVYDIMLAVVSQQLHCLIMSQHHVTSYNVHMLNDLYTFMKPLPGPLILHKSHNVLLNMICPDGWHPAVDGIQWPVRWRNPLDLESWTSPGSWNPGWDGQLVTAHSDYCDASMQSFTFVLQTHMDYHDLDCHSTCVHACGCTGQATVHSHTAAVLVP